MMSMKRIAKSPVKSKKALSPPESQSARQVGDGKTRLSDAERQRMVAEAAYYRALQRGFVAGGELDDWLAAERDIDRQLAVSGHTRSSRRAAAAPPRAAKHIDVDMKASRSQ
jgi:hypothetical protein